MERIVTFKNDAFCVIDELRYFTSISGRAPLKPRSVFYDIWSPFLMDSQVKAINNGVRRKRRLFPNYAPQYLIMNSEIVESVHNKFLATPSTSTSLFDRVSSTPFNSNNNNNYEAREAVKNAPPPSIINFNGDDEVALPLQLQINPIELTEATSAIIEIEANVMYTNHKDHAIIVTTTPRFIIPAKSTFAIADVNVASVNALIGKYYNLVVLDPPWPNKSVKRKKTYDCFELSDLCKLRIPQLLSSSDGGLICIWMPNNETINKTVHRMLEQDWRVVPIATWHWLKVCRSLGEAVCAFRPDHKLPFESILFACRRSDVPLFVKIPDNYCIIGTPNANHSRKPPLAPILKELEIMGGGGKTLELYARYLVPNTTSIGYEPLKFQNEYYFDEL